MSFRDAEHGLDWDVNATDGYIRRWVRRDAVAEPGVSVSDAEGIEITKAEADNMLGDRAQGLVWTTRALPDEMVEARGESADASTVVTGTLLRDGTILIYNQMLYEESQPLPAETSVSEAEAIQIAQTELDLEGFRAQAGLSRHLGIVAWHVTLSDYESIGEIPESGPRSALYIIDAETGKVLEHALSGSSGWADRPSSAEWYERHRQRSDASPALHVGLAVVAALGLWCAIALVLRRRRP